MRQPIASMRITAQSLPAVRELARQVGELFGLETLQRTRFVTATSEIARNTAQYAGEGTLAFLFDTESPRCRHQCLVAEFSDQGPGIPNLREVTRGTFALKGEAPPGIAAAQRLVDHLNIDCPDAGGTTVTLEMGLPRGHRPLSVADIEGRARGLSLRKTRTPQQELEHQNQDLILALEELRRKQVLLEQADVRKNEFMAMLAHELRSPLATQKMTLAILARSPNASASQLAQRHEVIGRQTDQMVRMVSDLTDVMRVDKGKVELHEAAVEVNSLVKDALEMTAAALQEHRHDVDFETAPHDLWLLGDPARLLQVFGNIIQNAAKYTPDHGHICVSVSGQESDAVIEVSDNGVGIAADMLPRVFGLFVQARPRSPDANAGLGIGLSLAERLVRDHGGSITVQSPGLGRGSRFTIRLPLTPGLAQPALAPSSALARPPVKIRTLPTSA